MNTRRTPAGYGDPPSPPLNTNNPFQVHRGYGLHNKEPPSQRMRAAFPISTPTPTSPFIRGSNRHYPLSSPPTNQPSMTRAMRSPLSGSSRTSHPTSRSGTHQSFPPLGFQMPEELPQPRDYSLEPRGVLPFLPTAFVSGPDENPFGLRSWPDESSSDTDTDTNPSLTQSVSEETVTPSTPTGEITSGPM